jgi:hypothetical protein
MASAFLRLLRLFAAPASASDSDGREKAQKTQQKVFAFCLSLRFDGLA